MEKLKLPIKQFTLADLLLLMLIAGVILSLATIARQWQATQVTTSDIQLSAWLLPKYTLFSVFRAMLSFAISLAFTFVIGFVAAKSTTAEKILIPLLDILQSIPVLGFMPGLVIGLSALFPTSNIGLELTCVLMIFTGQAWNMAFSFYNSLKTLPVEYSEAAQMIGFSWWEKLKRIELPFSAVGLSWNCVLSMAGGWFFLTTCEAFNLGSTHFRLPGLGAYMATAIEQDNNLAMFFGIATMIGIILGMDFLMWRPLLAWVQRFRTDEIYGETQEEPLSPVMELVIRDSKLIRFLRRVVKKIRFKKKTKEAIQEVFGIPRLVKKIDLGHPKSRKAASIVTIVVLCIIAVVGTIKMIQFVVGIPWIIWLEIFKKTFTTFLRVMASIVLSSLWVVPLGIWIGLSAKRVRIAQPILQVLASFPTPMLYPLMLAILFKIGFVIDTSSIFLMALGIQWYILFNVIAGAVKIPRELNDSLSLIDASKWDRMKYLYLPSIFPALVTGWVTAAGGAWNASIVAEYVLYKNQIHQADGIGAFITAATESQNFQLLAASLFVMILAVIGLNRFFWARIYHLSQTRFRVET
ncbi:MAG: ABC transporter permease [Bacteriovoracia bacterium]